MDLLTAMLNWVEKGQAPSAPRNFGAPAQPAPTTAVASGATPTIVRSRPMYPYSYMAAYDGHGNPSQVSSYTRGASLSFNVLSWAGSDFYDLTREH
jgi:feruloyl esterase